MGSNADRENLHWSGHVPIKRVGEDPVHEVGCDILYSLD